MENRDIKFRGVFLKHKDDSFSHFQYWGLNMLGRGSHQWLGSNNASYHKVSQQFTGLYDKNGKEIYEGDIVNYFIEDEDEPDGGFSVCSQVKNISGCWVLKGIGIDKDDSTDDKFIDYSELLCEELDNYEISIIGNIYENPELIN